MMTLYKTLLFTINLCGLELILRQVQMRFQPKVLEQRSWMEFQMYNSKKRGIKFSENMKMNLNEKIYLN